MATYGFGNFLTSTTDRVLLAFDGGQNAAVTARVLQDQGFAVEALFLQYSTDADTVHGRVLAAAKKLGIPLHMRPAVEEFAALADAADPKAARAALVLRLTAQAAEELGFDFLAAGYYANVEQDEAGGSRLTPADDARCDDSALLCQIDPALLDKLLLPLGAFDAADVRAIAAESGLTAAQ